MKSESIEWKRTGSRVHGKGKSYNCLNIATAKDLHQTLTTYEKTTTLNQNIEQQYDKLTKKIIQIQLTLGILNEEIQTLHEAIKCLSK